MALTFTVYGVPQPQGSSRAFVPKGWTRAVVTSANPKNKGWRQLVAEGASRALADHRGGFQGPVRLQVSFWLPRPKTLPKGVSQHTKRPDTDKLIRSVNDALTGVVGRDDSQVVEIMARKHYAAAGDAPHATISVSAVEERDNRRAE
jgi:Holliday junction resolvase RusA-like endonuclease